MKLGRTFALLVLVLAGLFATASVTRADVTSPPRDTVVCTPNVWRAGCTTPISLNGLWRLLDSDAAILAPLTNHFVAWADDCQTSLGSWAKVDGLDGSGQTVELMRVAGGESKLAQSWLNDLLAFEYRQSDVTVTLLDSVGEPVASWQLSSVIPVLWSIQVADSGSSTFAVETLSLSYQGLTSADPC